jgi:hypothetical protein
VREQVFLLDLPEQLPFLEVRPHTFAEDIGLGAPRWRRRASTSTMSGRCRRKYALAVLQPVLVADLLDGPDLAWRIYEEHHVAWSPGLLDPKMFEPAVTLLQHIETSIPAYVSADYTERAVTPNPNDVLPY